MFFSGCNMRCSFCHNPEALYGIGEEHELNEVVKRIERYKSYLCGVTLSGGEPFLQADFCWQLCDVLHDVGIEVIAETNGLIADERLLKRLDGIRLDVKNQSGESGAELICRYSPFLNECKKANVPVLLTNVLLPSVNDGENNARALKELKEAFPFCEGIKLLPFHSMCKSKYDRLNIPFPCANIKDASREDVEEFYKKLNRE